MKRDVVVLLSGGVDSSVLASRALADGRLSFPLFIDYGQPSAPEERTAAEAWCSANGQALRVLRVCGLGNSPLAAGAGIAGPRVVQGRNMAFVSLAAMVVQPGSSIWIGANADDRADYPDCRPSFFNLLSLAMRMGGAEVAVEAPFALVSRESIVSMAAELGVNLTSTWSCYEPVRGQPCGSCDACRRGPQRGDR
jgi:7-cyano-7-deazaguanine synthase